MDDKDKKDLYDGWLADKEKHVYQVDTVQPMTFEDEVSPINAKTEGSKSFKTHRADIENKNNAPRLKPYIEFDCDDVKFEEKLVNFQDEPPIQTGDSSPRQKRHQWRKKN